MLIIKTLFWITGFFLLYVCIGYPVLLGLLSLVKRTPLMLDDNYLPTVSLIIAAYNEEAVIGEKIENSLKLDYPREKLEIIVFSDASSDGTDEIVKGYVSHGIKLVRIEGRKGKTYCQNEVAKIARGEILVFSDANSMYNLDAIRKLVRNFADKNIGSVSGELRYRRGGNNVEGERVYWGYEQILKKLESRVSSIVGANGAITAVRKDLYEPLYEDVISDFVEALKIVQKGYRVIYEPEAVTWEDTTESTKGEFRRRFRMTMQSAYSFIRDKSLISLLNPFRHGFFSIQLWSHRVLRWLYGIFLLLIFVFNIPLVRHEIFYAITMTMQVAFYLLAIWGFLNEEVFNKQPFKLAHIAYYFCLSCYAMLKGVYNGLTGRTIIAWQPRGM